MTEKKIKARLDAEKKGKDSDKKEEKSEEENKFSEGENVRFNKEGRNFSGKITKVFQTNEGETRYRILDRSGTTHSGLTVKDLYY